MSLWERFLTWLFGPDEDLAAKAAEVHMTQEHNPPTPLVEGDVVRTHVGPVTVLGVDEEGIAWCRYTYSPQMFDEVIRLDSKEDARYRMPGVKHVHEKVPS